jgi:hypothetical protein
MMAIAEHQPEKLYKRNRVVLRMSSKQRRDFASTKEKNLPKHASGSAAMAGLDKVAKRYKGKRGKHN